MIYLIIGCVLVFNFVVFRVSSNCSRQEERMYLEEYKKI